MGQRFITKWSDIVVAGTLLLLLATPGSGWTETFADSGFTAETVATLEPFTPVGLAFAPDGSIFVWEKGGRVRIVRNGTLLPTPFIDIQTRVNQYQDRGLLGLAVDPNFSTNRFVYLLYTVETGGDPNDSGPKTSRLSRVTANSANPDVALPGSEVFLLDGIPATGSSHTIGTVRFAPDGTLFVGSGDGASPNFPDPDALRAQDLDSLNGKILRLNPDGSAAQDNPFSDGTNSNRSKVWAYGLRNPFRFSLHPVGGEPVIGDVGWGSWEEVNIGRGANFGWPCFEGNDRQPDYNAVFSECQALSSSAVTAPLYTYHHSDPDAFGVTGATVIGGPIYTGSEYPVQYQGSLFIADYVGQWIRRLVFDADGHLLSVVPFAADIEGPVTIEQGPDGLLYYIAFNSGEIRRIRFNGPIAKASVTTPTFGFSPLDVTFSSEGSLASDGSLLSYAWEFGDGDTSPQPNPTHRYTATGTATFTATLTITDGAGRTSSDSVRITVGSTPPIPNISAPPNGLVVFPGQTIIYQGSAIDPEDGPLDASALSWIVLLHHNTHLHVLQTTAGAQGSFDVTDHGQGTFAYEIVLTARDSSGLTETTSVLLPATHATIAFDQPAYTVNEAAGTATITLRRTGGLGASTTARVSMGGGTAIAGTDYTPLTNKVVTFAVGADTATFAVTIVNNTLAQADKTVGLQITGVGTGAGFGTPATATLTIVDDDAPGSVQFSAPTYEVTEGTATATITVTRTGGTASGVTVQYRVTDGDPGSATGDGVDYTLAPGTLSFGANETSKTFTVAIVNDTIIEDDETVNLELFNPTGGLTLGAQSTAVLTIHDNDAPTFKFGSATYTVAEGAAVTVMVLRANGLGSPVTVDYAVQGSSTATGGQDDTLADGTLTFGVGVTSQPIPIPTLQDTLFEGSEKIVLKLINPSKGTVITPDTTTVTITDNDTPGTMQFSAATYGVDENAGPATVRVTRSGANLASNVTVQFTTTNGTATAPTDYADATQILTFVAGETFKEVPITIVDDVVAEGNRTVLLTLSNPSPGAGLGAIKTAVLTIRDDEQGLQFSAPVYIVNEATPAVTITVVRTGPMGGTVTVDYASAAGSATPGADYANVSGTLTFGPGMASRTFTVPIINDTRFEATESVALLLNNPTGGARLGPLDASTITIVDNDPPGAVRFSAATYTVAEAMAVATITVQRTPGATASAVTVDYATVPGGTATAGADYLLTSGTLTFNAGETSKTFTVPILNDKLTEPNERVNLALSNPTGGATLGTQSAAVLTITDDDVAGVITFSAPTFTVGENAGSALIKVTRTGTAGGVTVDFTTADGTATQPGDYTPVLQTLSFAAAETSKTVAVPVTNDPNRTGKKTVRLVLFNPTGGGTLGATGQAVLTITDLNTGPVVGFGATTFTVAENVAGGMASVTIVRSGSTVAGQSVLFSTGDGTATAGVDYTAVTNQAVTFTAGQTTATVKVPIVNNTDIVGNRTVNLALSVGGPNPIPTIGTPATAVLTVLEDDATIQFANATYNVVEGGVATLTVTRTGGAVGSATVAYATSNGTAIAPGAYTAKAGTLTFGPGVTSRTIAVTTLGNTIVEGPRTFTVTLSSPGPTGTVLGSPSAATVTITDDDAPGSLQFSSATYSVVEGASAILTVTRTGGSAGTVTMPYATSDGGSGGTPATGGLPTVAGTDYTATSGVLTFTTGVTSRAITVPTKADALLEGPETFTVTLSPPSGGATLGAQATAVVMIVDAQAPRLQFATANYSVAESAGSVTLTVQRIGPTTAQNTVDYTLAGVTAIGGGVDFVSTGGTLTFAPGIVSRPIVIPIVNDTINEVAETFTVTLSTPTGGAILGTTSVATVTIRDNDPAGSVQFSQASYAVIEGETATITVTRTGTSGPVTVDFTTSDGTASAPDDYTSASGTLTFQAGETTKTFTVATASDGATEGSESVNLVLSGPTNGLGLGSKSTATLWILDRQQSMQFSSATASVVEGKTLTIAVTRSGVPEGTVTVDYQVGAASSAATPTDVTLAPGPGTLTFPPGVTTRTITVQAGNNNGVDAARSLVLELVNPAGAVTTGAPSAVTITLIDNDRPDLVVTTLTAPAQAATGAPMTVTVTVRNQAGAPAPATSAGIFISQSSNQPGVGYLVGLVPIPALAGGASFTATASLTIPPVATLSGFTPGTFFLSAFADIGFLATEGDETNNGLTAATQVDVVVFK
jgi:glucose/arabinose dehydrogenase